MTAKKTTNAVETVNGSVTVDPAKSYRLTLAKALKVPGDHVLRPADRNIEVTGEILLLAAADVAEGVIINATPV